jgi:pyruvate,water dikinase
VRAREDRQHQLRADAEQRADAALSHSASWQPRRLIFRWVLRNARMGIRNREAMRLARTRIYAVLREMLRSIGEQFAAEGILDRADDIFFLTLDEVWDFIKGTAVATDLRGIAALRAAEYEGYRAEQDAAPDNRFVTYGPAYHKNRFRHAKSVTSSGALFAPVGDGRLQGAGCCPGITAGRVTVASDPAEALQSPGGILVAARTDPGWVTAYAAFQGILVERGSMLSHSAIVARELGIPTIVGVDGLTARLRSGQHVRMDGAAGTIEILATTDSSSDRSSPPSVRATT